MFYPTGSVHSVVPAHLGWSVAWPDDAAGRVFYEPVIAWFLVTRVEPFAHGVKKDPAFERSIGVEAYAITVDGLVESAPGFRAPDGAFSIAQQRIGMSEAEYVTELKKDASKPD
jgi:hypothetical protein